MRELYFEVTRTDKPFRVRKINVVLKMKDESCGFKVLDCRRMFGFPLFAGRLARKQKRMLRFANKMLAGWQGVSM